MATGVSHEHRRARGLVGVESDAEKLLRLVPTAEDVADEAEMAGDRAMGSGEGGCMAGKRALQGFGVLE